MNEQIAVPEVLLVGEDGKAEQLPTAEAIARAQAMELDLIEVSPKANPPVVKIGEYGNYLYQLKKKEKKHEEEHSDDEEETKMDKVRRRGSCTLHSCCT